MKICVNGQSEFITISQEQNELILKCLSSVFVANLRTLELYEEYFKKNQMCKELYNTVISHVEEQNKEINNIILALK